MKLPDGGVRQVEPPWAGKLSGFTLLLEALALMLAAAACLVRESRHRVAAICERYVELALAQTDLSAVRAPAIDETSRARGHDYITRRPTPRSGVWWRWPRAEVQRPLGI